MKTPPLIDVPKTGLSRYQKLKAFKKANEIQTHHCPSLPDMPWMALHMPSARELGYGASFEWDFMDFVAKLGRLLDEAGISDYGKTEREAVRRVCENVGIPCEI